MAAVIDTLTTGGAMAILADAILTAATVAMVVMDMVATVAMVVTDIDIVHFIN